MAKLSIVFAFLLNFGVPLKATAQYATRYTYDESGNVTSRRDKCDYRSEHLQCHYPPEGRRIFF